MAERSFHKGNVDCSIQSLATNRTLIIYGFKFRKRLG